MKLKVCGMKYEENIRQVAALGPDYMGFIFYPGSKRYVEGALPSIPKDILKTGVFVNASLEELKHRVDSYGLEAVQLHGDERPGYCKQVKEAYSGDRPLEVIKAFAIKDRLPLEQLKTYLGHCDHFLFDTKGKQRGGTGKRFDWSVLEAYALDQPYMLSGGIGPEHLPELKVFLETEAGRKCMGIDLNSRFERAPALKDVKGLKNFFQEFKKQ